MHVIDGFDADLTSKLKYLLSGKDRHYFTIDSFGSIKMGFLNSNKSEYSLMINLNDENNKFTSIELKFYPIDSINFPIFSVIFLIKKTFLELKKCEN